MSDKTRDQNATYNIDELDDAALEDVAGGGNLVCPTTSNTCNMVANCGGTSTTTTTTAQKQT